MQLQGIGTSWMAQPPIRRSDDSAYEQLISRMSLTEVKAFLCAKSHGDPLVCIGCLGFRNCGAGQRAVRLLDDETVPDPKTAAGNAPHRPQKAPVTAPSARVEQVTGAEPETPVQAEKTEDDEISLEDFLNKFPFDEAEADRREEELRLEDLMVPFGKTPQEAPDGPVKGSTIRDELNAKYDELNAEKTRLRAKIKEAEEKIRWIEDQQDALAKCLSMFVSTGR